MKKITFVILAFFAVTALHAQIPPPTQTTPARARFLRQHGTNDPLTQPRYPQAGQAFPGGASGPGGPGGPGFSPQGLPAGMPGGAPLGATPVDPLAASTQPEETVPPGTINFQGVDLNAVLEIYAKYVGRTLIRGALPDAKIILKTETPLTKSEVIQALQAVLALNGISVVNIGDKFVKVLPSDQANSAGAEIDRSGATNLPNMGSYVTHITQLKYVKPSLMMPLIAPFSKLQNSIFAIDDNGILVIRDYAENVKRMLEMIDQVDVSVPAEYVSEVIPIRYAKVDEIASALNSLGGGGGGATVSIGGSSGNSPISGFGGARGGGIGGGGIGGGIGGGGIGGGGGYQANGSTTGAFGSRTGISGGGAANPNGTPTGGSSFAQRLNNIINRAASPTGGGGGQDQIQLFGQTKIIPNESSSSLLIYATRQDLEVIKGIIAKLDVPLAQVLIEAVIIDYSLGPNTFNFSLSAAQNPAQNGNFIGGGGVNNGNSFASFMQSVTSTTNGLGVVSSPISTITSSVGTNGGAFANSLPGGLSYFGSIGSTWDLALSAVQSDSHASVIQRPRIQTSQAKAAQFFVGDTVPYVTGNTYGGAYGNSSSYSQLSVGVELDVTPFINPDGLVVMDISQEIDDLNGYTTITGVGNVPNTIKRTLNSEIAVRDRDTVMLGGFIKSNKSTSRSGVPLLMDIPLLGNLFTSRSDSKAREELIVLMRPTVLQTPELAAKNTIKEEQRLPGASQAAAEDAAAERKLIEAQRKREQKKFNANKQYDGFFNPEPDASDTNRVPVAPAFTPVAPAAAPYSVPAPTPSAYSTPVLNPPPTESDAQAKARAAVEAKMRELDANTPPQ
jgi:general secretion pathway protein D